MSPRSMCAFLALVLAASTARAGEPIAVARPKLDRPLAQLEHDVREGRPPLRNFYPPMGSGIDAPGAWRSGRWSVPAAASDAAGSKAAELVARSLAKDGLLATLAAVLEAYPKESRDAEWLASVGLPLDWLSSFSAPTGGDVLAWLRSRVDAGVKPSELAPELARCAFAPRPSVPGFEASLDDGGLELGALRLQIPGGAYWQAREDGSGVDLARCLFEALPDVEFVATIEEKHLEPFLALSKTWELSKRTAPITIVPQDMPNAQWAQDDGRSGTANGAVVTLTPRYASRGDETSSWTPGEMRALESFAATGRKVARSPLLFQGGNAIVVRDPKRGGERVLLLGEAEVYRNTSLGLTQAQAIEAFRVEFGVQRVLVLPAVAYHIDYEVSPRVVNGELVCFVADGAAAAVEVLRATVDVLEREKKLDEAMARSSRLALERRDPNALNASLAPAVFQGMIQPGIFRESFAKLFRSGEGDSHVANFHRIMLALDVLMMSGANEKVSDRFLQGFIDAFQSRNASQRELVELLRAQGWRIVPVPSLSDGARSITYLNGVQADGVYLMPAWGGLFAQLDAKARAVFEKELGPSVRVVPILSGESQRRNGAVRCAVSPLAKG